jgi:cytochrome c oxidase assembly protein subunit 15
VKADRAVSNWLFVLAFMVFGMVAGGGHARTIGASFIMQSWQPVTGFLPPLTALDWARQFALFQQTAIFHARPISLAQYKALFWPTFLDRDWGRLMALVFLVPLGWFLLKRRVSFAMAGWLLGIFAAGGAQAVFGWYMVETGLHPGVLTPSPEWGAPHFAVGMLIFGALLWTALSIRNPAAAGNAPHLRPWANASIGLIFVTMCFGALVATSNALSVFNTFPLMDGRLIPPGMFTQTPATVQFFHRTLASLTTFTVLTTVVLGLREAGLTQGQRDLFLALGGLVALQFLLGMVTIVLGSGSLGYIHELNAVLLLACALAARHSLGSGRFFKKKLRKKLLISLGPAGDTSTG